MNSNTNNDNLRHESLLGYAEEWGLLFERWGLPRTAGRIWGWLHVCEPPQQTAAQLVDALGVSKGSVSTNTRLLESLDLVERVGVPGARQSHYGVRDDAFEGIMRQRIVGVAQARALAERGLNVLEAASPERKQRLTAKRDFYAFLEREMEELLRHWQGRRESGTLVD
ncbi:MAG: MarR family transcriptional regulator [Gemmatimonadetes bacterium]|nr:MarR family transcriptional regulator [Gemmatimonadota bacterium]NIO31400.1 MarR family transcriptional regulator [Gemmatimonadota bacterium]